MMQVESRLLQAYVDLKTATLDDALQDFLPEQDPVLGAPLPSTVGAAAHELVNALVRHTPDLLQSFQSLPESPIMNGRMGSHILQWILRVPSTSCSAACWVNHCIFC